VKQKGLLDSGPSYITGQPLADKLTTPAGWRSIPGPASLLQRIRWPNQAINLIMATIRKRETHTVLSYGTETT